MDHSRVSAVITTYNYAEFIREAIESVLAQTLQPDEIVVIDDGSTDATPSIVAEYAARGVRYVRQENAGAAAARNRGLQEARGEFIAYLDADDIWLPGKLAAQVRFLRGRPDAVAVSGSYIWWHVRDNLRWQEVVRELDRERMARELTVSNVVGNPSMALIRRAALEQAGPFNTELHWGQDWEMFIRLARLGVIGMLPQPMIIYRWHDQSLSNDRRWERLATMQRISSTAIAQVEPAWWRPILRARSFSALEFDRARIAISEERPWYRRVWHAVRAFAAYPFEQPLVKGSHIVRAATGNARYVQVRSRLRRDEYA
jgi:glycosyltransferase involved in cell wall biosynthesis